MNLTPIAEELTEIIKSLQDFINDNFNDLTKDHPLTPEEFSETMRNHYCDFLDSTFSVEKVLEKTVEKLSSVYEDSYNKELGLAKVYNIYDYQKKNKDATVSGSIEAAILNHPSNYRNDNK